MDTSSHSSVIQRLGQYYGDQLDRTGIHVGFPGGFLNIGYWKDVPLNVRLSTDDRVQSQIALYRQTLSRLSISPRDRLLEVACGRGRGCVLALDEFAPAEVHGVDIMPSQIARAKTENARQLARAPGRLVYQQSPAGALPYPDRYFDKIYTVEAFLYFGDLDVVMNELTRVMRRPGRVAITCVFATTTDVTADKWLHLFDESGVANAYAVSDVVGKMVSHGFKDVQTNAIGEYVWLGYKTWIEQSERNAATATSWYNGYKRGLFDYYTLTASLEN